MGGIVGLRVLGSQTGGINGHKLRPCVLSDLSVKHVHTYICVLQTLPW